MLQVLVCFAAIDDAILATIDLKQEEHIVLVDLAAIVALDELVNSALYLNHLVKQARIRSVHTVTTTFSLNFGIDALLLDEVTF